MKKIIAIFSILALAVLVAGPSMAGNSFLGSDLDDSVFTQTESNLRTLRYNFDLRADIDDDVDIDINSGGNLVTAGGDMGEDGPVDIETGDASLSYTEQSDVNGADLDIDAPSLSGNSNDIDVTDADDTAVVQVETNNDNERADVDSRLDEDRDLDADVDTGNNGVFVGDDFDQGSVKTGDPSVDISRTFTRNVFRIFSTRN